MNIVLLTFGFVLLMCAIVVFALSIVRTFPLLPEPALLVFDDPLPEEAEHAEAPVAQEVRA